MRLDIAPTIVLLLGLSLLAGCVTPKPSGDAVGAAAAPDAPAAATTVAIAFHGSTPPYAEGCAWAVLFGQCAGMPAPGSDFSKVRDEPTLNGTPTAIHATISWTPVSPATQQMTIFAGAHKGNDYKGFGSAGAKMGVSPITLDLTGLRVEPGYQIYVGLAGPATGSSLGVAGMNADANGQEQPWTLSGTVTLK